MVVVAVVVVVVVLVMLLIVVFLLAVTVVAVVAVTWHQQQRSWLTKRGYCERNLWCSVNVWRISLPPRRVTRKSLRQLKDQGRGQD